MTHGVFLYDSTLRIAFMMAGPGIPAGLRVKQQARTIDFLPTLLAVMGGRADGERTRPRLDAGLHGKDGRDRHLLCGDALPEDEHELV